MKIICTCTFVYIYIYAKVMATSRKILKIASAQRSPGCHLADQMQCFFCLFVGEKLGVQMQMKSNGLISYKVQSFELLVRCSAVYTENILQIDSVYIRGSACEFTFFKASVAKPLKSEQVRTQRQVSLIMDFIFTVPSFYGVTSSVWKKICSMVASPKRVQFGRIWDRFPLHRIPLACALWIFAHEPEKALTAPFSGNAYFQGGQCCSLSFFNDLLIPAGTLDVI